jgi:sulfur carrier protein
MIFGEWPFVDGRNPQTYTEERKEHSESFSDGDGFSIMNLASQIEIQVNGEERQCPASSTIADLLSSLEMKPKFVAVEQNEQLVPRAKHAESPLNAGDRIEIVTLVGGG